MGCRTASRKAAASSAMPSTKRGSMTVTSSDGMSVSRPVVPYCRRTFMAKATPGAPAGQRRRDRMRPVMAILKLPGGSALSDFRLEKLNAALGAAAARPAGHHRPALALRRGRAGAHRRGAADPRPAPAATGPSRRPRPRCARAGCVLVTPRLGTISPWSSKATDIARQCGLDVGARGSSAAPPSTSSGAGDLGRAPAAASTTG